MIAAEPGRPVSTVSRELDRNPATRRDMPEGYTPTAVRNALIAKIHTLPEQPRRSLT